MNRRASLPGADELFRSTSGQGSGARAKSQPRAKGPSVSRPDTSSDASGRVKHDQKITVYVTEQELLDMEQARLRLRAEFDIAVDRGRLVREAVAELLQELHERGPDAAIVRRLT